MAGITQTENLAQGINSQSFQAGINDVDSGSSPERGLLLPWVINPAISWLNHQCWIESELDAGAAIHRVLPQSTQIYDSLGGNDINSPNFATFKSGVNLLSKGSFTDISQRMANSRYRFCLKGWAIRAGYLIPIPKMVSVAGVPAIPDDSTPQRVIGPRLVTNNYGIPIYYAAWALWYTVIAPPKTAMVPPANLAEHITATESVPAGIQVPISQPDQNAMTTGPNGIPTFDALTKVQNQPTFQAPVK
jgi:hypothetical protein